MDNNQLQEAFKKFLEQNKDVLPVKIAGRPKGSKNKPITEVKPDELKDITLTKGQEKQILKQRRKPRQLTEEQKATMLKNLEAGRQRLKELKEAGQFKTKKQTEKEKVIEKKEVIPVKVKATKKPIKQVPLKCDTEDESSDSDDEPIHHAPVEESETEPEVRRVRKRVEKKKQVLDEINKTLETLPQKPQSRYSSLLSQRW